MPKAYSYIRFSSPQQAKGDSYRRQLELATTYAKANGLDLAETKEYTFFDKGKSGYQGKNLDTEGQLKRFLDLVDSGEIEAGSYLLVESLDRLSREKVQKALPRFIDLLNNGIHVVTLSDGKLYRGGDNVEPTDILISLVMMMRAHEESATKGDRVSASWSKKQSDAREHKKPLGKVGPGWLQLVDGEYKEIPERVAVVKRIYQMAADGAGAGVICGVLNAESVPTFGKSNVWNQATVRRVMTFRAVLGEYQPLDRREGKVEPKGEPIKDYYPRIIDDSLFYQVQGQLAIRSVSRPSKKTEQFNIWHGISKCLECGSSMQVVNKGKPPKGYVYLTCYQSRSGGCKAKPIRIELADSIMPELLVRVDALSLVQNSAKALARELDEYSGRLRELETKISTIAELHEEFPSRTTAQQLQDLELQQHEAHEKVKKVKAALAGGELQKDEFLTRLNLYENEGRVAANNLLKRLELKAYFRRFPKADHFSCWLKDGDNFLFSIEQREGKVRVSSFTTDQVMKQVGFGELSVEQAAWDVFKIEEPEEAALEYDGEADPDAPTLAWSTNKPTGAN